VLLGSANFTTAAFRHNLEAGLRVHSERIGLQFEDYVNRLIEAGYLELLPGDRGSRGGRYLRPG
jgi:phosphatidylserine/phosphatidylglycerophosphate/cardiolipin synthase-like enzyme